MSLTSAIVSGITAYEYRWPVNRVLASNLYTVIITADWGDTHFVDKDASLELTDQENTTVAISSLIAIVSTIEVALAVCAAWSSDSLYQPTQEHQVSQVCDISYGATMISFISWHIKFSQSKYMKVVVYSMVLHRNFPSRVAPTCTCVALSVLTNVFSIN